jgi:hypothetical protein
MSIADKVQKMLNESIGDDFIKADNDMVTVDTGKLMDYFYKHGVNVNRSDIESTNKEKGNDANITFNVTSMEHGGNIQAGTFSKIKSELEKIKVISVVYINTDKYQVEISFDSDIDEVNLK